MSPLAQKCWNLAAVACSCFFWVLILDLLGAW